MSRSVEDRIAEITEYISTSSEKARNNDLLGAIAYQMTSIAALTVIVTELNSTIELLKHK